MATRAEVYAAIDSERDYQNAKWGVDDQNQVAAYVAYIAAYVNKALADTSAKSDEEKVSTMHIIRKIGALAVRAMEQHGAPKREA